ncbi:hypothetical protein [Nonomuraea wenchangensis]|uniref:hypothetical protein n=1 Tax=Nonomuraea wenchangensis TaxID=568860 RepID=UPI00331AFCB8
MEALLRMEICVVDSLTPGSATAVTEVLREARWYAAEQVRSRDRGTRRPPQGVAGGHQWPQPAPSAVAEVEIDLIP